MDPVFPIYQRIESLWQAAGTWPDYLEAMRMTLIPASSAIDRSRAVRQPWVLLPGLCCQSAGGESRWADAIAAAWSLLYIAAHLLDSVEDSDLPESWLAQLGLGPVVNIATGLLVSASLAMNGLHYQGVSEAVVAGIMGDLYCSLIQMCSGQHHDLTQVQPSLEACWQVVEAKSGQFFAFACRAGARLVIGDSERLGYYSCFGHHLGVLIQIGDDASDVWPAKGVSGDLSAGKRWTLPVAYTMAVSSPQVCIRLDECLQVADKDPSAEAEARRLIEGAGAALYLAVEAERHRQQARLALEAACSPSMARDELMALLASIVPLHPG